MLLLCGCYTTKQTEDIENALASDMNGHIVKPIEIGKLMNTLAIVY